MLSSMSCSQMSWSPIVLASLQSVHRSGMAVCATAENILLAYRTVWLFGGPNYCCCGTPSNYIYRESVMLIVRPLSWGYVAWTGDGCWLWNGLMIFAMCIGGFYVYWWLLRVVTLQPSLICVNVCVCVCVCVCCACMRVGLCLCVCEVGFDETFQRVLLQANQDSDNAGPHKRGVDGRSSRITPNSYYYMVFERYRMCTGLRTTIFVCYYMQVWCPGIGFSVFPKHWNIIFVWAFAMLLQIQFKDARHFRKAETQYWCVSIRNCVADPC